jgi:hypothetical protein
LLAGGQFPHFGRPIGWKARCRSGTTGRRLCVSFIVRLRLCLVHRPALPR